MLIPCLSVYLICQFYSGYPLTRNDRFNFAATPTLLDEAQDVTVLRLPLKHRNSPRHNGRDASAPRGCACPASMSSGGAVTAPLELHIQLNILQTNR